MGMTEGKVQKKIIDRLEEDGYYVIKLIKTNKNGIPDIVALPKNCNALFIEVKTDKGVVSPLQEFRMNELRDHGIRCEVSRGHEYTKRRS